MSTLPILYSFRRCPYAIRARTILIYADIKYEHREILLKNKPAHMLSVSPKGTVPVFCIPPDTIIDESMDIIFWALAQNDFDLLYPLEQKNSIDQLVLQNDTIFKPALDHYKYPSRYPEQDWVKERDACMNILISFDKLLSSHSFLLGDRKSLADIAIFPFVRQYAFVNKEWFDQQKVPFLHKWLSCFLENDLFIKSMEKHPLYQEVL